MSKKTTRKTSPTKKASNSPFYKKWWFWVIFAFLVIGGIGSIGKCDFGNMPSEEHKPSQEESEEYVLTRFDLEAKCQELATKLTNSDVIKIIDAWGNSGFFTEHAGGYDSDGNPIGLVTWYGKNKVLKEAVRFSCWGSGSSKDDISIYSLSMNGEQLYGSLDFSSYNQDGKLIERD